MASLLSRLTSPLTPADFLSSLGPSRLRPRSGTIQSVRKLTPTAASITIRTGPDWVGHVPGQFVTLAVDIAGVRHTRCYSIVSEPTGRGGWLEIAVQATEGGFVSQHLVHDARAGDVVTFGPASGDFTLPPIPGHISKTASSRTAQPLLFVTGGSGITPVLGMIRSLGAASEAMSGASDRHVVLIHHAPTRESAMYADELEELSQAHGWLDVSMVFTRSGGDHLDPERLDAMCPDWKDRLVYTCGPQALIDFVADHWADAGLAERVSLERFVLAVRPPNDSLGELDLADLDITTEALVCFDRSGRETMTSGGISLLELAEASGLAPQSGCRMGICHTCTTKLESGCVTDMRDGRISEPGTHVQVCVSTPVGDVTLDM